MADESNLLQDSVGGQLKERRLSLGITLEELSKTTGFSIGYLSKVERSDRLPPFSTLQTLTSALNLSMGIMLDGHNMSREEPPEKQDLVVVKRPDIATVEQDVGDDGYTMFPLTRAFQNRNMSPVMMYIKPGKTPEYSHDAEEFNHVEKGPILFHYKGETHVMRDGDSFYFDSRIKHSFSNPNDYTALVLTVIFVYRRF